METRELEKDTTYEAPHINSWRQAPSRDQVAYATDLCRSELPYSERVKTIATFTVLDSGAMSALIDELKGVRARRMARLRRSRRRPR